MKIDEGLNPEQQKAVCKTEGPLLILAGAGSGKTRVLTHRIAYLIEEKQVDPWNILAITFTNKAANEMRNRVDRIAGGAAGSVWVSTFHSTCVRILRRYIDRIGYQTNFGIYDTDDQKNLMKAICKKMEIDTKQIKERTLMSYISSAKEEMITPQQYADEAGSDYKLSRVARVYQEYQDQLHSNNALDFDDLLVKTVELFKACPDVLESYQDRFRYIMIDEYQDTNTVQFEFVRLLAGKHQNLCVVGDDDQSIYKFRGANIRNILEYEKYFPKASVIKLEQNYRSTQNILEAANEVISNNRGRKEKRLWTENPKGGKITFRQFQNGFEEAEYICGEITQNVHEGNWDYRDCAVLYRTNAQSRLFEEKFMLGNTPYRIVGGVNFYSRREIKDILAYMKTIDNGQDDLSVRRIINVPKRGIGAASVNRVQEYADSNGISFFDALYETEVIPGIGRSAEKLDTFCRFIRVLRTKAEGETVSEILKAVIDETGYVKELEAEDTDEARARIENIDELINKAVSYEQENEAPSLSGFLEEVALIADIDSVSDSDNCVLLMTIHSAKGLEFPHVFLAGMEDGVFPSYMTITNDDPTEIEEERRLCYVGITRAKQTLTVTAAQQRMVRGEIQYSKVSRFVKEIPRELIDMRNPLPEKKEFTLPDNPVYDQMKAAFKAKVYQPKQFKVDKSMGLDYQTGDRVRHIKFGVGIVQEITEGGRDYEVTVDFDEAGTKKMFASFAKLKKI